MNITEKLCELEEKYGRWVYAEKKKRSPYEEVIGSTRCRGGDRMHKGRRVNLFAKYIEPYIGKPITLVEIGVCKGTGIAIWSDLFPKGRIIGLDIDLSNTDIEKLKKKGAFKNNNIELYEFDQYAENDVSKILKGDKVNFLIDDGAHTNKAILNSYKQFKPFMDGVYFIEDNKEVKNKIKYTESNGDITIILINE